MILVPNRHGGWMSPTSSGKGGIPPLDLCGIPQRLTLRRLWRSNLAAGKRRWNRRLTAASQHMVSRRAEEWVDSVFGADAPQPPAKRSRAETPSWRDPKWSGDTTSEIEPEPPKPPPLEVMSAQLTLLRAELSRAQHTAAAAGLSQPPRINLQTAPQIMAGSAQLIATGAGNFVPGEGVMTAPGFTTTIDGYAVPVAPHASPPLSIPMAAVPSPGLAPAPVDSPLAPDAHSGDVHQGKKALHNEINRRRTSRMNTLISAPPPQTTRASHAYSLPSDACSRALSPRRHAGEPRASRDEVAGLGRRWQALEGRDPPR